MLEYSQWKDLKGRDLYRRKDDGTYNRQNFLEHPDEYECTFGSFAKQTDILMNDVDRRTLQKTPPYEENSVDVMAVSNLPNELPRDASRYFGEQLIKFIPEDLVKGGSAVIERATIVKDGKIPRPYLYLNEYGGVS